MSKTFGEIYVIRNLLNGKLYVGQTTRGVAQRWRGHIKGLVVGRTYHGLKGAMMKYGIDNFSLELLDTADTREELDAKERAWIASLGSLVPGGYNLKDGGQEGSSYSAESRERNRQAQLGKKHTAESKAKMSAARKGKPKSPEHVAKVRKALSGRRPSDAAMARSREVCTGRKMSDEFKENNRRTHLGKKDSDATREKKRLALLGRKFSDASIAKMKATRNTPEALEAARLRSTGRKHSPETKAKIGAASRARKPTFGRPPKVLLPGAVNENPSTATGPESTLHSTVFPTGQMLD